MIPLSRYRREAPSFRTRNESPAWADSLLVSLGCDQAFVSDLLGDLREEYADLSGDQGVVTARLWYVREIVRSTPHALFNALRNPNPAARARCAAYLLAAVATVSLIATGLVMRDGPPARLIAATGYSDGVVVNSVGPVRLSIGVVDASGHRLARTDVRYHQLSATQIHVSDRGIIRCTQRGDALIRASLGDLNKDFVVHCEPIKKIRDLGWGNFMVGDRARSLTIDAIGLDGTPVTLIAARLAVADSTVATLDSGALRPLRPGFTRVDVEIGGQKMSTTVTVFERVATFDGLRRDQRWVVAPIHLTRGQSVRWQLPIGDFFIAFGSDSTEFPVSSGFWSQRIAPGRINMSVAGPIMCIPELRPGVLNTHCLAREHGATLTIAHPGRAAGRDIVGLLSLERWGQP